MSRLLRLGYIEWASLSIVQTVLPVIHHPSNDANFQAHFMRVTIDYTRFLNPNQKTAVGCSDQPLYAIKKKLQWNHLDLFPESDYFPIMGGLHIEMQLLKLNGQLVKGTGLDTIIDQAGFSYIGLKTAIVDVNDIKKARHTVQIVVSCLYKKLKEAHVESGSSLMILDWAESVDNTMFQYWYSVLNLQVTILLLVRSFREDNMKLMLKCMEKAVPLCFALGHTNYARWMSVYIQDLKALKHRDADLFEEISENMSVRTSNAKFSRMARDQKHEHNNKWIKSQSGYISLVNKEEKPHLRKLEICSGEVHHYLESFEMVNGNRATISGTSSKHKEESDIFNMTFMTSCNKVYRQMTVNPFTAQLFQMLNSSTVFP